MYNQKILDTITKDDYNKYSVIEPGQDSLFSGADTLKKTRVIVDSRIRNTSLFPNQNKYDIEFDDNIDDIISCRLIYSDIPTPMYLVNSNFNKIVITIGSTDYTITLTNGNYTPVELATEIQTKLNSLGLATFGVTYVTLTDNYTFSCDTSFTLKFAGYVNPLNQLLGFSVANYVSNVSNIVKSVFRRNFEYNNYLIMDIEQFDVIKSADQYLDKTFAIIPISYTNLNLYDKFNYTKYFSPTLNKLSSLKIRFYDKFGNPYDFQNMDHRFELLFESHKHKKKYARIFNT